MKHGYNLLQELGDLLSQAKTAADVVALAKDFDVLLERICKTQPPGTPQAAKVLAKYHHKLLVAFIPLFKNTADDKAPDAFRLIKIALYLMSEKDRNIALIQTLSHLKAISETPNTNGLDAAEVGRIRTFLQGMYDFSVEDVLYAKLEVGDDVEISIEPAKDSEPPKDSEVPHNQAGEVKNVAAEITSVNKRTKAGITAAKERSRPPLFVGAHLDVGTYAALVPKKLAQLVSGYDYPLTETQDELIRSIERTPTPDIIENWRADLAQLVVAAEISLPLRDHRRVKEVFHSLIVSTPADDAGFKRAIMAAAIMDGWRKGKRVVGENISRDWVEALSVYLGQHIITQIETAYGEAAGDSNFKKGIQDIDIEDKNGLMNLVSEPVVEVREPINNHVDQRLSCAERRRLGHEAKKNAKKGIPEGTPK